MPRVFATRSLEDSQTQPDSPGRLCWEKLRGVLQGRGSERFPLAGADLTFQLIPCWCRGLLFPVSLFSYFSLKFDSFRQENCCVVPSFHFQECFPDTSWVTAAPRNPKQGLPVPCANAKETQREADGVDLNRRDTLKSQKHLHTYLT